MTYRSFLGGLWMLVVLAGAPAAFADAGKLTVVGAGGVLQDAERKAFFEPFAALSGVALTEDSYSGQVAKVRAMVDSGSVSWDVMQVEQNTLLSGCAEGLFEELDWSRIGKREDFIPEAYIAASAPSSGPWCQATTRRSSRMGRRTGATCGMSRNGPASAGSARRRR